MPSAAEAYPSLFLRRFGVVYVFQKPSVLSRGNALQDIDKVSTHTQENRIVKTIWKRSCTILASLALALAALGASQTQSAYAESGKPIMVASLAGTDEILSDLLYLTEAAGVGDFGRFAALMASPYTATLDKARPTGVYATLVDESDVRVLVFVPVKDLKMLLLTLEEQIGKPEELGGGVLRVAGDRPQPIYIKEVNGWAFVANRQESLNDLPRDPLAVLDGMDQQYTLAIRLNVANIPAHLQEMAISELRRGFQERVDQELDQEQVQVMRKLGDPLLKSVIQFVEETDHVTLGWEVDKAGQKTYLDVNVTAREGTDLAQQMATVQDAASGFAGFLLPGAAMTLNAHGQSSEADIEQVTALLAQLRSQAMHKIDRDSNLANDEERQTAKDIVNDLLDLADATVKAGKTDLGATLVLQPGALGFAAGGFVADGDKLAGAVKKLAGLAAQKDPNFPGIQFDAETYQGVTFHTAEIPLRKANPQVRGILGDPMNLVIGTGKESAYLAFGKDPTRLLKNVLDASSANSSKQLPPSQLRLSLAPILTFVAAADSNPQLQAALQAVQESDGDGVSLTGLSIPNGFTLRLELEEGVIKAIGAAAKSNQQP